MIAVRAAVVGDADAIARIWNAEIRTGFATFTTEEKKPADIAARLATPSWPGAIFLVSEVNAQITGFAATAPFRAGPGYAQTAETTVYLAPESRGVGAGKKLMAALEIQARARGLHLLVAAIAASNARARAFHTGCGFCESGILPQAGRKCGKWLDLCFMHKHL